MKRCPECRRDYYDDTLSFCLDDGSRLLDGPAHLSETPASESGSTRPSEQDNEPATAILSESGGAAIASDRPTQTLPQRQAAKRDETTPIHKTSSAEHLATEIKRHKIGSTIAAALLALVVAGIGWGIYKYSGNNQNKPAPSPSAMKITRLTTTGQASDADISPDGKYVVHVKEEAGRRSLWLRQIETTSDTQIVPPSDEAIGGITFSRDGAYIYYTRVAPNSAAFALYQVPLLGGAARKLNDDTLGRVTLSPDGKQMAFGRRRSPGDSLLVVANSDGTGEREVAMRKLPNSFSAGGPSWSPDGKSIASGVLNVDAGNNYHTLVEIDAESGVERRLTPERWSVVGQLVWLPDKSGLVFTATPEGTVGSQVWHVSYPGGEVRRV